MKIEVINKTSNIQTIGNTLNKANGKMTRMIINPFTSICMTIDEDNQNIKVLSKETGFPYYDVKNVNIIVPKKVVEVTFADGTKEKSVCREPDVFSLESAISICISKKIIGGSSAYNNAVKRGMKVYEDKQKKEVTEKAEQERIEKKRAKRLAYRERRAAKRDEEEKQRKAREREEKIAIQTEAYLRAMDVMRNDNRGV